MVLRARNPPLNAGAIVAIRLTFAFGTSVGNALEHASVMKKTPSEWLVVGAGISGLTAAKCLQANNRDYALLERCPALGGLTRTTQVADFCFDYTGHFLHLGRYR